MDKKHPDQPKYETLIFPEGTTKAEEIDPAEHADLDHFVVQETYPFPLYSQQSPFIVPSPNKRWLRFILLPRKGALKIPFPRPRKENSLAKIWRRFSRTLKFVII